MEQNREFPPLSTPVILGVLSLMGAASTYALFGLAAFPRQEWLLELLAAALFLAPAFSLLRGRGRRSTLIRWVGAALLLHAGWDVLHVGVGAYAGPIQTPIEPLLPKICIPIDLIFGVWLAFRGR